MVALTPRCAIDLGYTIRKKTAGRPYIEVSGRKGFGVKADDLLDQLNRRRQGPRWIPATPILAKRTPSPSPRKIGVGALRYFMLRFTRNTVIAFDFKDALSFEGETAPTFSTPSSALPTSSARPTPPRKPQRAALATLDLTNILDSEEGSSLWETWLLASKLTLMIEQCIATAEPAYLAKYAFQLAPAVQQLLPSPPRPQRGRPHPQGAAARHRRRSPSARWFAPSAYLGIEAPERM